MKIAKGMMAVAVFISAFVGSTASAETRLKPTLIAESVEPAAGETVRLAIKMSARPGWHGYWLNPGDVGAPLSVRWSSPEGTTFGKLAFPAPSLLSVGGMTSFVLDGDHTLLVDMKLPKGLEKGEQLPIAGALTWLACSQDECVAEKGDVSLTLEVGEGGRSAIGRDVFRAADIAMPRKLGSATVSASPKGYEIVMGRASDFSSDRLRFYPATGKIAAGALQVVAERNGQMVISLETPAKIERLAGVVTDGHRSWSIDAKPTAIIIDEKVGITPPAAEVGSEPDPTPSLNDDAQPTVAKASIVHDKLLPSHDPKAEAEPLPVEDGWANLLSVLGMAVAGGLLLNLMPCVFPILSIKALSLARAGASEQEAKVEGVAYTLGTVAVCAALGGLLVALRAAGMSVGWSFQLQNPKVVAILMIASLGVGLNLLGIYEFRGLSVGGTNQKGAISAFGAGALSAFIATPCSGPFMAVALGAAMVMPAREAMLVFAGLGLGMGLPFLALGWIPYARKMLPRPGMWMVYFKHILALPMLITVVGLGWILEKQAGANGLALGIVGLAIAAGGLFILGKMQRGSKARAWMPAGLAAICIVGVLAVVPTAKMMETPSQGSVIAFSEAELMKLRAEGKPVFLDFTAAWCLTCQVNEKMVLSTKQAEKAFAKGGVVRMVGDWTSGDPAITKFLAKHRRDSIPFYVYYGPEREGQVMPQILTQSGLEKTIAG